MSLARVFDDMMLLPPFYSPANRYSRPESASETEYTFKVNVPGYGSEDLELSVDTQSRILSVTDKGDQKRFYWSYGLPRDSDLDGISASVDRGVLTLTVARVPPKSHVRMIEIN